MLHILPHNSGTIKKHDSWLHSFLNKNLTFSSQNNQASIFFKHLGLVLVCPIWKINSLNFAWMLVTWKIWKKKNRYHAYISQIRKNVSTGQRAHNMLMQLIEGPTASASLKTFNVFSVPFLVCHFTATQTNHSRKSLLSLQDWVYIFKTDTKILFSLTSVTRLTPRLKFWGNFLSKT